MLWIGQWQERNLNIFEMSISLAKIDILIGADCHDAKLGNYLQQKAWPPMGCCLGPSEPRFLGDVTTAEVHSMIINDWQSYPLNSLLVETNFQNFEENCVIFNAEFDQGLEDLVQKSFDLDE
jgi:hypothetical protein